MRRQTVCDSLNEARCRRVCACSLAQFPLRPGRCHLRDPESTLVHWCIHQARADAHGARTRLKSAQRPVAPLSAAAAPWPPCGLGVAQALSFLRARGVAPRRQEEDPFPPVRPGQCSAIALAVNLPRQAPDGRCSLPFLAPAFRSVCCCSRCCWHLPRRRALGLCAGARTATKRRED